MSELEEQTGLTLERHDSVTQYYRFRGEVIDSKPILWETSIIYERSSTGYEELRILGTIIVANDGKIEQIKDALGNYVSLPTALKHRFAELGPERRVCWFMTYVTP